MGPVERIMNWLGRATYAEIRAQVKGSFDEVGEEIDQLLEDGVLQRIDSPKGWIYVVDSLYKQQEDVNFPEGKTFALNAFMKVNPEMTRAVALKSLREMVESGELVLIKDGGKYMGKAHDVYRRN